MSKRLVFRVIHKLSLLYQWDQPEGHRWVRRHWAVSCPEGWLRESPNPVPFHFKRDAVRCAVALARGCGQPAQVVIHGRDGKIQREYTYPRSSDPRPTKAGKYRE